RRAGGRRPRVGARPGPHRRRGRARRDRGRAVRRLPGSRRPQPRRSHEPRSPPMTAAPDRIEQLKADLAELNVDDPAAGADRLATRLGLLGLAAGIILAVVAYAMSHGTDNPLSQRDALVLA